MTDEVTLNLKLPTATLRKLQALALLSGRPIPEIEDALSAHVARNLDDLLTGEIAESLNLKAPTMAESEITQPIQENEHALSGDDDDGVDSSPVVETAAVPAKQEAEEEFQIKSQFKDVDNNADAFLDVALETPAIKKLGGQANSDYSYGGQQARTVSKSFSKPRVTIKEHTGEE